MLELSFCQKNSESILFIDTEQYLLDNIYSLFPINYKVHTTQTLDAAWKILRTNKIDCIFCNVNLASGQNGVEFLKICKANGINIPFVLVSGDSNSKKVDFIKQYGVTDVLMKPLNQHRITKKIKSYLASPAI